MNTHLSPEEFVEALDGALAQSRRDHLNACDSCRRDAAELGAMMSAVQKVEMPEPSPLFWDRFSARVRVAVETTPEPVSPFAAWWKRAWRPLVAVSTLTAVATLAVLLRTAPGPTVNPSTSVAVASPVADADDEFDPSADESFGFVTSLASNLSWDDLMTAARPTRDSTASAIGRLTPAQQATLIRLIEKGSGGEE